MLRTVHRQETDMPENERSEDQTNTHKNHGMKEPVEVCQRTVCVHQTTRHLSPFLLQSPAQVTASARSFAEFVAHAHDSNKLQPSSTALVTSHSKLSSNYELAFDKNDQMHGFRVALKPQAVDACAPLPSWRFFRKMHMVGGMRKHNSSFH
jgi:hypothetical protein